MYIRCCYKCGFLPHDIAFNIFDKCILPILLYGSEIWGHTYSDIIEQVHVSFCKKVIGVGSKTSNVAVLGECGRHPLYIFYYKKCIAYWLKLLTMPDNRYAKSCYIMLKKLDEVGKVTWVTHVRNLLYRFGFGFVWLSQTVGNKNLFLLEFMQRVKDISCQNWCSDVVNSCKLRTYYQFKSMLEPEKYLSCLSLRKHIVSLSKFRCSNHDLAVESGRYKNIDVSDRICELCNLNGIIAIEDEYHFLLICPSYKNLRNNLIPIVFRQYPTFEKFIQLMKTDSVLMMKNIAIFINKSMEKRKELLNSIHV